MKAVSKNVLEVATSLLRLADRLKSGHPTRRVTMAVLFEEMSDCLAAVAGESRSGDTPGLGRFALMVALGRRLSPAVAEELGESAASALGSLFSSGANLDALVAEANAGSDEESLTRLEDSSGKFRALVYRLDVSSYRSRNSVVVDLGETFMDVLLELAKRVGVDPNELATEGVMEFLQNRDDFADAVSYVLKKNEELYRRLEG